MSARKCSTDRNPNQGEYPKRESHFAHRVIRLLVRTCAAQEIGSDGCLLVVVIAHTEHAKWYTSPVTFWNDQLMSVLGFTLGKLDRARKKAVSAGWLHYDPGGKGKVGKYWTTIPKDYMNLPDGPVDEDMTHDSITLSSPPVEREAGEKRGTNEGQTGDKCGTFIPIPKPIPTLSSPEATAPKPDTIFEEWNALASRVPTLSKARLLTKERRAKLKTRLNNPDWLPCEPVIVRYG